MIYRSRHIIILLGLWSWLGLVGQISPGPLTNAHSKWEGMSNCTQCHDIGNKVPDNKCLSCHDEISDLIKLSRGFHTSSEVKEKSCVDCHSEHHGRKFEMTRFDEKNFNHQKAGYSLKGAHAKADCRSCHKPDYIADKELKTRNGTYLGLTQKCASCHEDFHNKELGQDCAKCHNVDAFSPAIGFDHQNTKFPLQGMHSSVDCKECHVPKMAAGRAFQDFDIKSFGDCVSCHKDEHNGQLPNKCITCHTETSFSKFTGAKAFDHKVTDFPLLGKHNQVNCFECHASNLGPLGIFQDKVGIMQSDCIKCHDDVHKGKFSADCARCHNEQSFHVLNKGFTFDHATTDFPLEGLHQSVDCKECHTTNYLDPIPFNQCNDCHSDYHEGQFTTTKPTIDCRDCHTLEQNFTYTTYDLARHNDSSWELDGSHIATPCFSCHISEEKWTFRTLGHECIDCHKDVHEGSITEQLMPNENCTVCHSTVNWTSVAFDHDKTNFSLQGRHSVVSCNMCHFTESDSKKVFEPMRQECISCHDNVHGTQFEEQGVTDCKRCHDSESWNPNQFDHSQTRFPLDGQHAKLDCNKCHITDQDANGDEMVIYKLNKLNCIDCHS